jgi:polysaccharide biosynthesis transport protein
MLQTSNVLETSALGRPAADTEVDQQAAMAPPLLLQYWQVALRWKWVILGIILSSLVVGLVTTLLITPRYTAKAQIEISREQTNITKVEGLETGAAGRDLEFYQTQYSLLKARSLADRVVRQLNLARDDKFFEAHGVSASSSLFANKTSMIQSADQRAKREKLATNLLIGNIVVTPVRGSALVDVTYTSTQPTVSAAVVNSWTQQFMESSMDRRFASTANARKFLEARLADLRARLETSERDLVNYASEKGIVSLGRTQGVDGKTQSERTLIAADLEAVNKALADATSDRIEAESRARARSDREQMPDPLTNGGTSQLRQKRAEVAAEYAKLMVQFEPGYPAARALAEQLRVLDSSISREEGRLTGRESGRSSTARNSDYQAATQRERELARRVEALKARLDLQQRDSIQYNIYQREADTNRELYDGLLQRYKEIGVAGVSANNIAIVDVARVPEAPSAPSLPLNMALALLGGLGLATLATLGLEQIDEGLREPSQVSRALQIPLLGSVPDLDDDDTLTTLADTKSVLSEAYLSIRSNLAFSTDHGVPRALMVTSTRAAEGKSTTSLALATVLGRTARKVLIIDADMRSPSIHTFLGVDNKEGLSNFLAGDNDWRKLVVDGVGKGLSVMPAGPMPPSAAELLSSDRMLMLVRQLLEDFDHIIIDAPPILGLADAPLLSRAVEGCVFVIEAEGVALRGIKASLGRLQSVHAHVYGAVLTKLKQRQSGYGYGYGYGYAYGQNSDGKA